MTTLTASTTTTTTTTTPSASSWTTTFAPSSPQQTRQPQQRRLGNFQERRDLQLALRIPTDGAQPQPQQPLQQQPTSASSSLQMSQQKAAGRRRGPNTRVEGTSTPSLMTSATAPTTTTAATSASLTAPTTTTSTATTTTKAQAGRRGGLNGRGKAKSTNRADLTIDILFSLHTILTNNPKQKTASVDRWGGGKKVQLVLEKQYAIAPKILFDLHPMSCFFFNGFPILPVDHPKYDEILADICQKKLVSSEDDWYGLDDIEIEKAMREAILTVLDTGSKALSEFFKSRRFWDLVSAIVGNDPLDALITNRSLLNSLKKDHTVQNLSELREGLVRKPDRKTVSMTRKEGGKKVQVKLGGHYALVANAIVVKGIELFVLFDGRVILPVDHPMFIPILKELCDELLRRWHFLLGRGKQYLSKCFDKFINEKNENTRKKIESAVRSSILKVYDVGTNSLSEFMENIFWDLFFATFRRLTTNIRQRVAAEASAAVPESETTVAFETTTSESVVVSESSATTVASSELAAVSESSSAAAASGASGASGASATTATATTATAATAATS